MQAWWAEENSLKTLKLLLFKHFWLVVYSHSIRQYESNMIHICTLCLKVQQTVPWPLLLLFPHTLTHRSLLMSPYCVDTQNPLLSSKDIKGSFGNFSWYFFKNPPSKSAITPSISTSTRSLRLLVLMFALHR